MHVIPMIITCMLQGTLCDTGIPCTFYGGNICSVVVVYICANLLQMAVELRNLPKAEINIIIVSS